MFEKLIDLIVQLWHTLSPAQIIKVYQSGGVLRFGKYHRTVGPGLAFKWPVVEEIIDAVTVETTFRLPAQSLTTLDDVSVVVAAIIKYEIVDIQAYTEKIWDQHDVLADTTMGAIHKAVASMDWADLLGESPEKAILEKVRNAVRKYGFKVHSITFTDLGRIRSYRLIQAVAKDIDN